MPQTPEEYQAGIDRTREAVNDAEAHSPVPEQKTVIPKDDNPGSNPSSAQKQVEVNAAQTSSKITPQPNVLDQYASYTYNISLFMITDDQLNALTKAGKPDPSQWSLLLQSGGASVQQQGQGVPGRNQFFPIDFMIDELEIDTLAQGKGSMSAHQSTAFKFKIFEPNGITLVPRLVKAAEVLYKQEFDKKTLAFPNVKFVLMIRFYGYDDAGNLVKCGKQGSTSGRVVPSDPKAVVEKVFPIQITEINFTVAGRTTEYSASAIPIPYKIAMGSQRGTIPAAGSVTGQTVGQILSSTKKSEQAAAADDGRTEQSLPPNPPSIPDSGYEALDYDGERNAVIDS